MRGAISGASVIFSVVVFLGCSVLICNAYNRRNEGYRNQQNFERQNKREELLKCYDCNSEYDPRCGDPFNPYTIGIINCTDRRPPEPLLIENEYITPIVCRKIVQKIEGKTRIVRGCGYIPDETDDKRCLLRSGTKNIQVAYCACSHSLCNTGHYQERPTKFSVIFLTVVTSLAIRNLLNVSS